MSNKSGKFMLVVALVAVLAMFMAMAGVSFAGGDEPTNGAKGPTVCVSGYVINHREQPVDGTKWTPALTIEAVGAESPDMDPTVSVTTTVAANGSYEFKDLPAGYYYIFALPLPADWDGIVPAAGRGSIAFTNWTQLVEKKGCYDVLFKIRRWFDVTVLKWEELQNGAVQPGSG